MTAGIKANVDGSGAIQTNSIDAIQISTSQAVTVPQTLTVTGTLNANGGGTIKSGTAQASTSGTSIDFTGIPSWVKRITVMFNGVSTNGSSSVQIQIGSGSITTSGYVSASAYTGASASGVTSSTGFSITANATGASNLYSGQCTISLISSNSWIQASTVARTDGYAIMGGGSITLGGALDRVRITTVNGTDTFDAGSINILYE
jgi:hypothetical protein